MSHGVIGVLKTDLAFSKVCEIELGHNYSTCENLNNHIDIHHAVQKRVNMVEAHGDTMVQVPIIIYALLAGTLSDKYGRRPLMIMPIVGQILEGVALLANKVWFNQLPLEALWLTNIYDILGGGGIWYLGIYSFAVDITTVEERASRMARFKGNVQCPVLFNKVGYGGAFR